MYTGASCGPFDGAYEGSSALLPSPRPDGDVTSVPDLAVADRSCCSSHSLRWAPPPYPPTVPSLRTTRWQGTSTQTGFAPFAAPTARTAPGESRAAATCPYLPVPPAGAAPRAA